MPRRNHIRTLTRQAIALIIFLALCLLPMGIALLHPTPQARGFWIELGVGLGLIAVGMLGVQFILTARFPSISLSLGQDTMLRFHRMAGTVAAVCVLAHPIVLIAAEPKFTSYFDPRDNLPRAAALSTVTVAVIAIIFLSFWRKRLTMSYEWWRLTHALLAGFIMLVALAHIFQVDHYSAPLHKKIAFIILCAVPLALLAHIRLLRPWLNRKRPWRVAEVRKEIDRVWTVTLTPESHHGFRFRPGQFAWITFNDSPMILRQHPFTIASSADKPQELRFTIKHLGDFTNTIADIRPGSTAFLEGPAGNFIPPPHTPGIVFIAGGIGITPAMALVRTALDRDDQRPIHLFYATETLEKAAFRDELAQAANAIDLTITHVPEKPPEDWSGPSGFIDADILREHLPNEAFEQYTFMICGPAPLMDAVENALLDLGVPRAHLQSERFDMI